MKLKLIAHMLETIPYVYLNYGFVFNCPFKLNNNVKSLLEIYAHVECTVLCHSRNQSEKIHLQTAYKNYRTAISATKPLRIRLKAFAAWLLCGRRIKRFEKRVKAKVRCRYQV